ncbi:hypothetical protein PAPYR_8442 [Paratrimastix pyriformis]|uniref:BRCT domain-containing protein n=1 Tax=Paratrimastix pyriformis TaxID=342808 RepID=A0ABQ8UEP4_9EUKA|nr:hypothetical protein PAPYR_8442 [Paratrimastix pyriformis]
MYDVRSKIEKAINQAGGVVSASVTKATTHLVADAVGTSKYTKAEEMGLPIVSSNYLQDCFAKGKKLPTGAYALGGSGGGRAEKEDDDDEEEEEEEKPKKKKAAAKKAAPAKRPAKKARRDEDEDEDDDVEEDDDDEEEAKPKAHKASAAKAARALAGVCICFTGKLSRGRADLEKLVQQNGGTTAGSVTKAVTHLICSADQSGTAKFVTAQGRGLPTRLYVF